MTKKEMVAELKAMGIKVDGRMSETKIAELWEKAVLENIAIDEEEGIDMNKMERANRCTVEATDKGYMVHFYRTHKHIGDIEVETVDGNHSNEGRENARKFAIGQCPMYGINWNPEQQKQAWERKYNVYNTDAEVIEDALTLITPALNRLVEKGKHSGYIESIQVTAITPKDSSLSYVEDGKYIKSGAWCVADIELEVEIVIGNLPSIEVVYHMEMKSGQICKPKTTIAEWDSLIQLEMELNGVEDMGEAKEA